MRSRTKRAEFVQQGGLRLPDALRRKFDAATAPSPILRRGNSENTTNLWKAARDMMSATECQLGKSGPSSTAHAVALMEDTNCCVMILARDTLVIELNDAAARALRKSPEVIRGTRLVEHLPDGFRDAAHETFARASLVGEQRIVSECLLWGQRWHASARRFAQPDGDDRFLCVCHGMVDLLPLPRLLELIRGSLDRDAALGDLAQLSNREFEVAALLGASLSDSEIASELHRSIRTVHAHRRSIGQKLGLRRRSEVADLLRSRGLAARPTSDAGSIDGLEERAAA